MKEFWPLLNFKVRCRLKSEASTNYLNYAWWVLEPLLYMATFYLVFAVMMNRGTNQFVAYLLSGLIPWLWFNNTVSNSSNSIKSGRSILMQTKVPLILFPAEVALQDLAKQLVVFGTFLLFLWVYGIEPSIHWLAMIPIALAQLTLILAVSFAVAAIIPFLPDARFLVKTGLMMLMFGSGIFYRYDLILPEHRSLFFLNPVANLIKNYRDALLYQQWPDWSALSYIVMVSGGVLLVMTWIFHRYSSTYVRVSLET